ncbi:hypothetical protein [Skermanella pratensis]|uniref:hypothetical protein n=1 Tax=Skermanella pratensis TaxID=2233999 RepID=UPI001301250A|nr:hypothetical protein [Skermanella pratensis]
MTIEQLQKRLREAHARIGFEGRFAFTIGQQDSPQAGGGCYVTHWFRPTPFAFEDCKSVGAGTVADCVAALDRYVADYSRTMTNEEVGMTLGIIPPHVERYKVAAE